jgi:hypothetical protein
MELCIETFESFKVAYLNYFNLFYDKVKEHNLELLFKIYNSTKNQIVNIFNMQDINNKAILLLNNCKLREKFKTYLNNILIMLKLFAYTTNKHIENKYIFYDDIFNLFSTSIDGIKRTINLLYHKMICKER